MKVNELLEQIKQGNFDLESALDIKKYLPIDVKKSIAQAIIYECTDNEDMVASIDSVQKYLSYVRYMITMHTNLEYTDEDYDILFATEYNGTSLLDGIIGCFERDSKECEKILNFMIEDHLREMSMDYSIAKFLNGLNSTISKFANQFEGMDVNSIIPDNLDMEKLSTFLTNYIK